MYFLYFTCFYFYFINVSGQTHDVFGTVCQRQDTFMFELHQLGVFYFLLFTNCIGSFFFYIIDFSKKRKKTEKNPPHYFLCLTIV